MFRKATLLHPDSPPQAVGVVTAIVGGSIVGGLVVDGSVVGG